ncbi:MAG: methionine--tRNA ligase [Spirochaetaceae bacterium]|nr:methionine--tRNA ligase [Spirochaetaceae bacterium]
MKKRLVTSALPYVNNIPHLGNLTQVLSADVFARFCRSKGYETLYVCGTDEYGTATETRALQQGVTPQELCDYYHVIHKDIYKWFNINFDYFGRTSTPHQTEIVQHLFKEVDERGYINEATIEQLYCPHCERFLADRFVEGTCPNCGHDHARGDQCDECQTLLEPTELINPKCSVCGTTPIVKSTKHLYLDLPKILPLLETWMEEASVRGFWAKNAVQVTKSWIRDGLKERAITRDLKWGIPVPKEGYENKVFYVWFDAPIGYLSITSYAVEDWKRWWMSPDDTELFQFIGKDNIPFHTVIFPATLLASGEKWTMLHHMSSTEYLNYEGGKFSKSNGIGIFGNDVMDTGIPADVWRFYMFYNRPEKSDVTFTWLDFEEKVNGELIGNLSNLVNRTLTFVNRFYDGKIPEGELDMDLVAQIKEKEDEIDSLFEAAGERNALRTIFLLSSIGNKSFQDGEPWKTRNEDPAKAASLLRTLVYLIRDLGILIEPYMPTASKSILSFVKRDNDNWSNLNSYEGISELGEISLLFEKLDHDRILDLKEKYSGSQDERENKTENTVSKKQTENKSGDNKKMAKVEELSMAEDFAARVKLVVSKIVNVEKHPEGDKLYILTLKTDEEEERTIVSSIVPYYTAEELLNQNIVLISNLKPAKFRGVKSCGMLLAASAQDDEDHSTCEVIFAPQFEVGTILLPEGTSAPEEKQFFIKGSKFFDMPLYTEDGDVKVDGKVIKAGEVSLTVKKYINGAVG